MKSKLRCRFSWTLAFFFFLSISVQAQINISNEALVTENFDGLAGSSSASLPAGWKMSGAGLGNIASWSAGTNVTTVSQQASNGSPSAAGRYNWGTSAGLDRAIGFMTDGSYPSPNAVLAHFRNNTGAPISSVTLTFQLERYRVNTSAFTLSLASSLDGTAWTERPEGTISSAVFSPAGSAYTFSSPRTVYKTVTISGLSIPDNGDFYLRWLFTSSGTDAQGIGLDNVTLTAGDGSPAVSATLEDELADSKTKAGPGDKITYRATITNTGTGNAEGVAYTNPTPANTTLDAVSVKTSALARNDDSYATAMDTPLSGTTVLANDVGLPSASLQVVSFGPGEDAAAIIANGSNSGSSDNGGTVVMASDGTFTYTPPMGFVGFDRFAYTAATAIEPTDTGIVTVAVGSGVAAFPESFSVLGNVSISPAAVAGVLANDGGDAKTVVAVNGSAANVGTAITTTQGGNLTLSADGSFTYNPPAGYEGSDQFTYTLDNGFSSLATATVTLTVSGMIWFVNNSGATAGDGRLSSPFNSLSAFQAVNNGSANNPAAGDNIFLYGTGTDYTPGLILLANQKLFGQGASLSLSDLTGLTPPANSASLPSTNGTSPLIAGTGTGIVVGTGNTIRGLIIGSTSGVGISGNSFGTLTLAEVSINTTSSGGALSLSTGTLAASFSSITSSGTTTNGIVLNGVGGTLAISSGTLSGSTAAPFAIIGGSVSVTFGGGISQANNAAMVSISGGHTGTLTFSGTLSATNGTGLQFDNADGTYSFNGTTTLNGGNAGIDILNGSGGTFTFASGTSITNPASRVMTINASAAGVTYSGTFSKSSAGQGISITNNTDTKTIAINGTGTKSLSTQTGNAVTITGNSAGTTVNFSGNNLSLTTTSGIGFTATGGGTVTVAGTGNSITSGTGTALNVVNTAIGAPAVAGQGGLNFQSISANGAANGIVLDNTGSSGGLTITGDAGSTKNNSGGTIQNTSGDGISLMNTRSVSLDQVNLQNTGGSGIYGTAVIDFSFTNGTINNSGTSGAADQSNIAFNKSVLFNENNVSGTVTITGNSFSNPHYHGVDIFNWAGLLNYANISNNVITAKTGATRSFGSAIRLIARGSTATSASVTRASLDNNTVQNGWLSAGIQAQGGHTGTGPAVTFGTAGHSTNVISISGNTLTATAAEPFNAEGIVAVHNHAGQANFRVNNNGTALLPIGKTVGTAISVSAFGQVTVTAEVNNNVVSPGNSFGSQGIGVGISNSAPGVHTQTTNYTVTINNNTVSQTDGNGILAVARDAAGLLNVSIKNNTVAAPLGGARPGIQVNAGSTNGDNDVCLDISGNTSAGSGGFLGIGLRKQGTSSTVNAFGIKGMAATSSPGVEAFVNAANPSGGGTLLISATSGFTNCTSSP
ncbi:beta strand repeat-containing protein [Cesiribacter andamanensis]|uniref:DUF11 domain-containing protein n=1 Tax=Cesiribacter andamanensis AMV16 TaxID=1279009 RepID=M7N288_9BACT|nr:Ig-like domain-containing protein [Cesiribacter andamanensis]EMR02768.1 hypothetical protein ADICEAN_02096 [Cesiribacter andamanensis AMV16]